MSEDEARASPLDQYTADIEEDDRPTKPIVTHESLQNTILEATQKAQVWLHKDLPARGGTACHQRKDSQVKCGSDFSFAPCNLSSQGSI